MTRCIVGMCCVHLCQCAPGTPWVPLFQTLKKDNTTHLSAFCFFLTLFEHTLQVQGIGGVRRQIITVHPNLDSKFLLIMMLLLSIKKYATHDRLSWHVLVFLNQGYNSAGLQHKTELIQILKVKQRKLLFAQLHVLPNLFYFISYANTKEDIQKKRLCLFIFSQ